MSHEHVAWTIWLRSDNTGFMHYIANFIPNYPRPKSEDLGYESILPIVHYIGMFMTIIKYCLLVNSEGKSIFKHHMPNC